MNQSAAGTLPKLQTYEQWRHCITVECGLELTPEYIEQRITALNNSKDSHTKRFVELYGEEYLKEVIDWFLQANSLT